MDTDSDSYVFTLIDNTPVAKMEFLRVIGEIIALGEVSGYTIFDGNEPPLFMDLLSELNWNLDGKLLYSLADARKKAHLENNWDVVALDAYLDRKACFRESMNLYIKHHTTGSYAEFTIAAHKDNFSNLDILFQLSQALYKENIFITKLRAKNIELLCLSLDQDRRRYQIIYSKRD